MKPTNNQPVTCLVMGVSASGKSTFAQAMATKLNGQFIDGDNLHPRANIDKMANGQPLNDNDRAPWLTRINDAIYSLQCQQQAAVVVCSALKAQYRQRIRADNAPIIVIYLQASLAVLETRIASRHGHFMKSSMLKSQLDSLEEPTDEPNTIIVDANQSVDDMIAAVLAQLDNFS